MFITRPELKTVKTAVGVDEYGSIVYEERVCIKPTHSAPEWNELTEHQRDVFRKSFPEEAKVLDKHYGLEV